MVIKSLRGDITGKKLLQLYPTLAAGIYRQVDDAI